MSETITCSCRTEISSSVCCSNEDISKNKTKDHKASLLHLKQVEEELKLFQIILKMLSWIFDTSEIQQSTEPPKGHGGSYFSELLL